MLIGASIWCVILGSTVVEGLKAQKWPSVDGVMMSSSAKRINHSKERYIIEVEYRYSVQSETFTGNKISSSDVMLNRTEKETGLKNYSPNTKVKVFYDPNNLKNSYLKVGVDLGIYILLIACFGMVMFSVTNLNKLFKN